jgi:uncharacterized membrane protein (UPF0127 family)
VTSPFAKLDTAPGQLLLRWFVGIVLVLGLLGCVVKGANSPADPTLASPGSANRTKLDGFGETSITVRTATSVFSWCLLLAETEAQHNRGLMQVTDTTLGGYDGMLFRFAADSSAQFYMRNTPMPLSIAFVDGSGKVVTTTDMVPCADVDGCQLYPSAAPYRVAIEVPEGQLPRLHIAADSTVIDDRHACSS